MYQALKAMPEPPRKVLLMMESQFAREEREGAVRTVEYFGVADDDGDHVSGQWELEPDLVPNGYMLHGVEHEWFPGDRALSVRMDASITREEAKRLLKKLVALLDHEPWTRRWEGRPTRRQPSDEEWLERGWFVENTWHGPPGSPGITDALRSLGRRLIEAADWLDAHYEDDTS
jgi:hypothetical protein